MANLRATLETLASDFAMNVVQALRGASLEELLALANQRGALSALNGGKGGGRTRGDRLGRRSAAAIERMVDEIATLLAAHPEGMRAEQIRAALGVEAKELPRPLADALSAGRVTKTGQKRATTYFAGGGAKRHAVKRKKS